jgi:hypothetical protein
MFAKNAAEENAAEEVRATAAQWHAPHHIACMTAAILQTLALRQNLVQHAQHRSLDWPILDHATSHSRNLYILAIYLQSHTTSRVSVVMQTLPRIIIPHTSQHQHQKASASPE